MSVEQPKIYQPENLADFLVRENSDLWAVAGKERKGPFDIVMDFGHSRDWMRTPVRWEKRIQSNNRPEMVFLGLEKENWAIRQGMEILTRIANHPGMGSGSPKDRGLYRQILTSVYQELALAVLQRIKQEDVLVFSPKNGGIFVEEVYKKWGYGFADQKFFDYRMARVQKEDGSLMVGIKIGKSDLAEIADYRTFVFADDCLASDISAWGTLEIIKEQLIKKGVDLLKARVIIAVSAATQRGFENLTSSATLNYFGFGSIEAIAVIPVFQMTGHFYLQHPDGRYVVGDMGEWTIP